MSLTENSCVQFADALASKAAVPGGGGASAMVGALGAALGSMVANLTIGKKAYRNVEAEIQEALAQTEAIRLKMLSLVQEDAHVFEPLSKAYGIKATTPEEKAEKDAIMEDALKNASTVPLEIARQAVACLRWLEVLGSKGSKLAVSDAGVGAHFCKAALLGGQFNVVINTSMMKDREYALGVDQEIEALVAEGSELAARVASIAEDRIKK